VHDGAATTGQVREWCWPERVLLERLPITHSQAVSTSRALRSIGAVRVRREGREWLWQLGNAAG
jgi:hypothetical protein